MIITNNNYFDVSLTENEKENLQRTAEILFSLETKVGAELASKTLGFDITEVRKSFEHMPLIDGWEFEINETLEDYEYC